MIAFARQHARTHVHEHTNMQTEVHEAKSQYWSAVWEIRFRANGPLGPYVDVFD